MRNNTLRALRAYLLLSDQEKLEFFDSIREIEAMAKNVRLDYKKSLLLRVPGKAIKPNF